MIKLSAVIKSYDGTRTVQKIMSGLLISHH